MFRSLVMSGDGRGMDLSVSCAKVLPQSPGKKVVINNEVLFAWETGKKNPSL